MDAGAVYGKRDQGHLDPAQGRQPGLAGGRRAVRCGRHGQRRTARWQGRRGKRRCGPVHQAVQRGPADGGRALERLGRQDHPRRRGCGRQRVRSRGSGRPWSFPVDRRECRARRRVARRHGHGCAGPALRQGGRWRQHRRRRRDRPCAGQYLGGQPVRRRARWCRARRFRRACRARRERRGRRRGQRGRRHRAGVEQRLVSRWPAAGQGRWRGRGRRHAGRGHGVARIPESAGHGQGAAGAPAGADATPGRQRPGRKRERTGRGGNAAVRPRPVFRGAG
ncbi:hypothetical protein D3C87_1097730 [compost metagenome]